MFTNYSIYFHNCLYLFCTVDFFGNSKEEENNEFFLFGGIMN